MTAFILLDSQKMIFVNTSRLIHFCIVVIIFIIFHNKTS